MSLCEVQYVICKTTLYLDDVLRVLRCVLEDVTAMMQVSLIQAQRARVHMLQGRIAKLRLRQVDQEVGVDRAALDQADTKA